jgi:NAD(P)H-quinone oxidoreductase subunit 4
MLSVLIWAPVLGAILISCLPQPILVARARQISLVIASLVMLWSIYLASQFDLSAPGMQFEEALPWIESLGLTWSW